MLWVYGQAANIPQNVLSSASSWINGNNLQCVIHMIIEEEQIKKKQADL